MSDLRVKPTQDNGDLPEQMELFDDGDNLNWDKEIEELSKRFTPSLMDIFNPLKMKEVLDKANGRTNKDKE